MKCQILFSGKNKKNISKCRLLKILPRVLSVNGPVNTIKVMLSWSVYLTTFFSGQAQSSKQLVL